VAVAALFVQPDPSAPSLDEVVFEFPSDRGAKARERTYPQADESSIVQAQHTMHLFFLAALEL
jgi:hypothetical protein